MYVATWPIAGLIWHQTLSASIHECRKDLYEAGAHNVLLIVSFFIKTWLAEKLDEKAKHRVA